MTAPRIFVTAASGQLGQQVVQRLAERAGPASVVAIMRDPQRAAGQIPPGVEIRHGDYDRPETLDSAFAGADRLLLISSNALDRRMAQHRNAVEAARRAQVGRLFYTSILRADVSRLRLAADHRNTEALIAASGLAYSLLRNGWYNENHAASIAPALQHGAFIGSAADGRISSAARADYAAAAAAALLADTGPSLVHELAGDSAYTLADFAAELSRQADRQIAYVNLPEAAYEAALVAAGLPEAAAALYAQSDADAASDSLFDDRGALSALIGKPTTPFAETIRLTLATITAPPVA